MKVVNKIFNKYSFLVILGLFAMVFILEAKAMWGYSVQLKQRELAAAKAKATSEAKDASLGNVVDSAQLKQRDLADAMTKATSEAKHTSLGNVVAKLNISTPGRLLFRVYKEELMNRITTMIKEFSQILLDYRTWCEDKPASSFRSWVFGSKTQEPPVPKYPQYDALKELQEDKSTLIKAELFGDEKSDSKFMDNLRFLSSKIIFNSSEIVGKNEKDLINFLNTIKKRVQWRMAWWMFLNSDYPYENYWKSKGINRYNDKENGQIIDFYYNSLLTNKPIKW